MNTQSNAVSGSHLESQVVAPAVISGTRRMYWSLRRELWEYRSIYVAPLAVAALILFGFLISTIHLRERMRAALTLGPMQQQELIAQPYNFAALLIMFTTLVVAVFYCLDALHGERRDRSILFWKSLPVSDLTAVLAKASIPLVVLPVLTVAITVVTQFIMLLLSTAILLGDGPGITTLWTQLPLLQMSLLLLYHLFAVHSLWYAPIFGWLLLVSGWARRAPFLWAGLPLLAIGIVEKIAFNTSYFAAMLQHRMFGSAEAGTGPGTFPTNPMTHLTPVHFLSDPRLWLGLALTAAFLAAAVRLRRYQGPI
jgi:ABC-2 type transport system permease protein